MKLAILAPAVLLTTLASTGGAHTYLVQPDGSGDFPTIQQAADAAVGGDFIELGPGTFTGPGNRDIHVLGPDVTIRSQSGDPASCIIDCQDAGRGFFLQPGGLPGTINLEGITITRGRADWGAAVCCKIVWPVITNCIFYRNSAHAAGGVAIMWGGAGTFVRCRFVENSAEDIGGAFGVETMTSSDLYVTFDECQFIGNTAGYSGGAIYLAATPIREAGFRGCSFFGNSSLGSGGAITLLGMSPLIDHCTFANNTTAQGGVIECQTVMDYYPASPDIRHSIIAFSAGPAVSGNTGCHPILTCSDLYGNAGGDWVGCIADQAGVNGNFSDDPLFCDPTNRDYTLRGDSPCAPFGVPTCGLVGAWPVGCGDPVPVRITSWGALKARFR